MSGKRLPEPAEDLARLYRSYGRAFNQMAADGTRSESAASRAVEDAWEAETGGRPVPWAVAYVMRNFSRLCGRTPADITRTVRSVGNWESFEALPKRRARAARLGAGSTDAAVLEEIRAIREEYKEALEENRRLMAENRRLLEVRLAEDDGVGPTPRQSLLPILDAAGEGSEGE